MIVWNGPVGQFNDPRFALGTNALAKTIAQNHRAWVVIGGGSTIRAIKKHRLSKKVLISTGGGAMLDFLTGRILPGLRPLLKH
jgi:phosphoglycerate kinase